LQTEWQTPRREFRLSQNVLHRAQQVARPKCGFSRPGAGRLQN
jgi:hypothetical protein